MEFWENWTINIFIILEHVESYYYIRMLMYSLFVLRNAHRQLQIMDYFNLGFFKTEKLRDREHCNHFTGEVIELLKQIPYE